jgi:hypothetical protein
LRKLLGEFNIDELQDPGWSDVAFDNLVLPEGDKEKELIMALAKRDRLKKGVFNDSVQHKGQRFTCETVIILPPSN